MAPLLRPGPDDLRRIAAEVADTDDIQRRLRDRHAELECLDRVAHQYQIAGSKVVLRVCSELPEGFSGVGLFVPGAEHLGIGRISTGLGMPHVETSPDFIGLRASFLSASGRMVDFLAFNDPASPGDNHREQMSALHATADAAGARHPVPSCLDRILLMRMKATLDERLGPVRAEAIIRHLAAQNARTTHSSTAYQSHWTGVVELNNTLGKFTFSAHTDENYERAAYPGDLYLTREWARRQAGGDIVFDMYWISYLDEQRTSLERLSQPWEERHKRFVGRLIFPRVDPSSNEARLWSRLAAETAANPGNWICDALDSVREPSTEFGLARKFAYERSARGRDALPVEAFQSALRTGHIDNALAAQLKQREEQKRRLGHVDQAPVGSIE